MSPPTRILATADWHLRASKPPCRLDDFLEIQRKTLEFIASTAKKYNVDFIAHGGDLFDQAVVPDWLKSLVATTFRSIDIDCVIGNHDVDYNNASHLRKTSLGVLDSASVVDTEIHNSELLTRLHCDNKWSNLPKRCDIVLAHRFVYKKHPPFPGAENSGPEVSELPNGPRLIITGDNHQSFSCSRKDQLIVNPGCTTRQRSDKSDHTPVVYIIDLPITGKPTITNVVTLPDTDEQAVSREHIEREEERSSRIQALTRRLQTDEEQSVSFEANLRAKMNKARMRKSTKQELSSKLTQAKQGE